MQATWTIAPWMRRRLARYLKRGTSERVIACVLSPTSAGSESKQQVAKPSAAPDWQNAQIDLSNVILFRALGGPGARSRGR